MLTVGNTLMRCQRAGGQCGSVSTFAGWQSEGEPYYDGARRGCAPRCIAGAAGSSSAMVMVFLWRLFAAPRCAMDTPNIVLVAPRVGKLPFRTACHWLRSATVDGRSGTSGFASVQHAGRCLGIELSAFARRAFLHGGW